MSIITISRGSYSSGKRIAQKVADKLGYECISKDIILEASEEFDIPELKLIRAIHDAPSIIDRLSQKSDKYIAYIQAALTKHFRRDNIVYHGLAGHFLVKGIPHVLKVRILADFEDRVACEMEREGVSKSRATLILKKDDRERRKWSKHLYGIDTGSSSLYDLVIHIHKITIDDAVEIICDMAVSEDFQTTPESQRLMDDLALSAEVKAALLGINLDTHVTAKNGVVSVRVTAPIIHEKALVRKIENAVKTVNDMKDIRVNVVPSLMYSF